MLVAHGDISRETTENWAYGGRMLVSHFIGSFEPQQPHGFLVEYWPEPGSQIDPHFHHIRQFQVVVHGGPECRVGKHAVPALSFHYTDPDSPYGPITAGPGGIAFFTLRARSSKGTYWMPGARDQMAGRARRNCVVNVDDQPVPERGSGRSMPLPVEPDGLGVHRLLAAPGERIEGPDPAGSGGQFLLVWKGAVTSAGDKLGERSLLWVEPDEPPPTLAAGEAGADVLAFQFPTLTPALARPEELADVDVGKRYAPRPA